MNELMQLIVLGLLEGGLYAMVAAAIVLVFKSTHVVSLAQGQLMGFGALAFWFVLVKMQMPIPVAIIVALGFAAVMGWTIERFAMRPLIGQPLFAAFLTPYSTFPGAIRGILNPYILIFHGGHSFSNLLTNMMGMDQPLANTRSMLFWLFIYTLAALIITAVNHLLHTFTKKGRSRVISTAVAVLISAPLISITTGGRAPYLDYFLPLPLVVGLFALYMILELGKTKPYSIEWKRALLSMSLSVFSLILLTRIFFNAKIIHYGFFLALPGFLVLLSLCLHRLPALMKRTTGDARIGLIPVMILIGCVLWSYCGRSFELYRIVDYPI